MAHYAVLVERWKLRLTEDVRNKTIIDIWNEVKEEEKIEREAFEVLASQVDIESFHQRILGIKGNKKRNRKNERVL